MTIMKLARRKDAPRRPSDSMIPRCLLRVGSLFVLVVLALCPVQVCAQIVATVVAGESVDGGPGTDVQAGQTGVSGSSGPAKPPDEYGDVAEKDVGEKPADQYGNVTEGEVSTSVEGAAIADPIEPFNRAMYHFNDKVYFWALKPVAEGYKAALPEEIRGLIGNFYYNLKAPIRIVNNLLQGKAKYAGLEFTRLLINSTIGVAGLRDCAKECFGITGRDADFGQTLGKYGVGHGFYVVWPFLGPNSARDSVGFVANWYLVPTAYVIWPESARDDLVNPLSVILYTHYIVNDTTFHLGDYESLKNAAIDPYIAMRDIYAQYRKKKVDN